MEQSNSLAIVGAEVVLPDGVRRVDLGIKDGRIVELALPLQGCYARTLDAHGLTALPGLIDTQVHFREPGLQAKEDIGSGSLAAIAGGVTTFLEMPNTKPPTTTPELLDDKLQRAKGRAWADYGFFLGATQENASSLGGWERMPGCCGVKVFMGSSTGSLLVADDATLREVLGSGRRRVAVHAEDETRLRFLAQNTEVSHARDHMIRRDAPTAALAVQRLLDAAAETLRPVHVLHVSSAEELAILRKHPARRLATAEVTPQHLLLSGPECYDRLGTQAVMNPPIRTETDRLALWQALRDGTLTCIGSDHAPHLLQEKALGYPHAPSGMPGVQTTLPLLLNEHAQGRISLDEIALWTAQRPAQVYQIAGKGGLVPGLDADIVLCDLKLTRQLSSDWLKSRCGWSPWLGQTWTGWPRITVLRGELVYRDDEVLGNPQGKPIGYGAATPLMRGLT